MFVRRPHTLIRRLVYFNLFLLPLAVGAQAKKQFQWDLKVGDILEINKFGLLKAQSGFQQGYQQFKNKIVLRVERTSPNYVLRGNFYTYIRPDLKGFTLLDGKRYWNKGAAFFKESEYYSNFQMQKDGKYLVPSKYFMPNLRHIPTFPKQAIGKNAGWKAMAEEILKLDAGVKLPLRFEVDYKYHGHKPVNVPLFNGKEARAKMDVFEFKYKLNTNSIVDGAGTTGSQGLKFNGDSLRWDNSWQYGMKKGAAAAKPVEVAGSHRLKGSSRNVLYFDRKQGIPVFDRNNYSLDLQFPDGRLTKYRMVVDTFYRKYRPTTGAQKDAYITSFKKAFPNKPLKIKKVDRGIKFTLGNILFDHDSDKLRPAGKQTLEALGKALKKHPNKEIQVDGFTDSSGNSKYNRGLSERRAQAVANYLVARGIGPNRISYKGHGEKKPVASNQTPQGRQKNRRVEVTLVTE